MTSSGPLQPSDRAKSCGGGLSAQLQPKRRIISQTVRTCIGCRKLDRRENLLRLVVAPDQTIAFDLAGGAFGRGAWVHPRPACLAKSIKGLARAFRTPIAASVDDVHKRLVMTAWRRVEALARAAKRAGHLIAGAEAGASAWASRKVALAIVAEDARASAGVPWVVAAQAAGRVIAGPPKSILGHWWGQEQVAVAAITDSGLATAIARAIALAQIPDPTQSRREIERGTEVG